MSQWTDLYKQKLTTPEEAVKLVKDHDWVDYGMASSQPIVLDKALAARKDELKDIKVRTAFSLAPRQIVEADPNRDIFYHDELAHERLRPQTLFQRIE
ncbi:hypothetical protein [Anaeroglobus geminatus]|uniref:Acetyl-CoA hydrolase/transferase N-terminal domain-containing protein n=1 Tax=Anaeroglobus geminatus F0357 TaxID=861450 RepID=G9YJ12_9FIRM|nr:hypothetical protein HMPREF0080_01656 [Anaeroglobus geminatus F0357]